MMCPGWSGRIETSVVKKRDSFVSEEVNQNTGDSTGDEAVLGIWPGLFSCTVSIIKSGHMNKEVQNIQSESFFHVLGLSGPLFESISCGNLQRKRECHGYHRGEVSGYT